MADPIFRPGATALITGGASGIGFAVAQLCRAKKMNLILVDVHAERLANAHIILGETEDTQTLVHVMDTADLSSWDYLKGKVAELFPDGVDFFMLNAGAAFRPAVAGRPWEDPEYFGKTFATNVTGIINGLSTFLPVVTDPNNKEERAIVITGSKQGITNPPGNPAYNASKSAVKTITEHLAHDLRSNEETSNVSVHLLVPGWTYTSLTGSGGIVPDASKPEGAWAPAQVADYMVDKVVKGDFYIICPDNETTESMDEARMAWAMGDLMERRPPLSRWDGKWKEQAAKWIKSEAEKRADARVA
ncbi:hypothetical protein FQN53_000476 [Emmonsiellopsis sp. PD_33]|nr:hypothetical protein FQN53_000476 [Emmonsiellopsis sp. PD_33]